MKHACRVCGQEGFREIFSHSDTPLFIGILGPRTPVELRHVRLPLALVRCEECQTIQQPDDPRLNALLDTIYHATHDNACSGTRTGEGEFGKQRAEAFLEGVGLKDMPERVLEIGCNVGHMLAICQQRGAQTLVGVEPSVEKELSPQPGIKILPGYFESAIVEGKTFDLAYMIEVLEHIPSPTAFLRDIRKVLVENGRLAVSVPNCESGLEFGNIGMPIHEHLLYFTPYSLINTLKRAGFKPLRIKATSSHIYCLAEKSSPELLPDGRETVTTERFWTACQEKIDRVCLFSHSQSGAWGVYGACTLTANLVAWAPDLNLEACCVVDSDPNKWGHLVSGCPQTTISPEEAIEDGVRDVIVMPFGFQENIASYIRRNFPALDPTLLYAGLSDLYSPRSAARLLNP